MMTIEQFRSPELSQLYTERYITRVVRYHAGLFESLIAAGEIRHENPQTLALLYVSPVITLLGICDREPEQEAACLEKLARARGPVLPHLQPVGKRQSISKRNTSMKKRNFTLLWFALSFLAAFALWTVLVRLVDVQPIGAGRLPHRLRRDERRIPRSDSYHWTLYTITDWMGPLPIAIALGFAVLGLSHIERKSLCRVDRSILVLGGFCRRAGGISAV